MVTLTELHIDKVDDLIEEEIRARRSLKRKRIALAKGLKAALKAGVPMPELALKMKMTGTGVYMYMDRHIPKDEAKKIKAGKADG